MTNLEKLIQVIGETFPGAKFDEKEIEEHFSPCTFLDCNECNFQHECSDDPKYDFWHQRYVLHDLKPEPDDNITTGYVVMVDDEGTEIPYSGCIHPTFHHAEDEVENAEYHGWTTSIRAVKFVFTSKGGGKNA